MFSCYVRICLKDKNNCFVRRLTSWSCISKYWSTISLCKVNIVSAFKQNLLLKYKFLQLREKIFLTLWSFSYFFSWWISRKFKKKHLNPYTCTALSEDVLNTAVREHKVTVPDGCERQRFESSTFLFYFFLSAYLCSTAAPRRHAASEAQVSISGDWNDKCYSLCPLLSLVVRKFLAAIRLAPLKFLATLEIAHPCSLLRLEAVERTKRNTFLSTKPFEK